MELKAKLKAEMKEAMKAKNKLALETIRSLLSAIQYEEMNKKVDELADDQILNVIKAERKKLVETKEFAEKDGRTDTAEELTRQLAVLDSFLPAQLAREEIERIISEYSAADTDANVGSIMKHLQQNYSGQYDGKLASEIARQVLAG
ncbi:MAG: GatB/YqeY domain-containing protein [Bdellovibrionales bacterium]|nr:GatB/YqeY domain-containing protein [Bdellovibrionales bacterium]